MPCTTSHVTKIYEKFPCQRPTANQGIFSCNISAVHCLGPILPCTAQMYRQNLYRYPATDSGDSLSSFFFFFSFSPFLLCGGSKLFLGTELHARYRNPNCSYCTKPNRILELRRHSNGGFARTTPPHFSI